MMSSVLFMRKNAVSCRHVVRWLTSVNKVAVPTYSIAGAKSSTPVVSKPKPLSPMWKEASISPAAACYDTDLSYKLYQRLSLGYQLPTVWYNNIMKKSIIDPLANFNEYDLPTVPGRPVRKEMPEGFTGVASIEDPNRDKVGNEKLLISIVTIRHKKMKKHKRKKFRKRMRFVFRKRRILKLKRRERAMQRYENEQKKEGELYSAENFVDEQLSLARKSGWHIDIIAEYNRDKDAAGRTDGHSQ